MKIKLGDKVKDKVTGFTGIVMGESRFLTGCRRLGVQSDKLEGGKPGEPQWFDEVQVDLVKSGAVRMNSRADQEIPDRKGGPQPTPKRHAAPSAH